MGPKRRRSSPWPLLAVSVLLLLTPSSVAQKTRLTALAGFIPFQGLGTLAARVPSSALGPSGDAKALATENAYLKDQVDKLSRENKRKDLLLEQALGMKQPVRDHNYRMIAADVIFSTDSSPWRKSLTVAMGTRDGVEKGMLVLYNNQIVGRVTETAPKTSRIQTVTDPGFRAAAVAVPRTYVAGVSFSERQPGVYEGTSGQNGQLKWLSGDAVVENGSFVVTTEDPVNGVPRGLVLGRVVSVNHGRGAFPKVEVESILNLRALEHVMLLVPPMDVRSTGAPSGGR
ncbi:MAG TPA: rod shape-determining protein MreC [Planctomycetota bacterium]|jgi:rod shape-determining protein MreC|nr:rod shape-determining protein MreC [Planctomycetota bacterium]